MGNSVNINTIQYVAVIGSFGFVFFILSLIRKQKIKEQYSLLWLFFGCIFVIMSIWRGSLEVIAKALGIAYAPAALFIIIIAAIVSILIHYSIVISRFSKKITRLVQEVGLLRFELESQKKDSVRKHEGSTK